MAEMESPSFPIFEELQELEAARRREARKLLRDFASRNRWGWHVLGWSEERAAAYIIRNRVDFGHEMGIVDPSVLEDVENYAQHVLRRMTYWLEMSSRFRLVIDEQRRFLQRQRAARAELLSSLLHHDYTEQVQNRATVGSRRCVHHRGVSDSTASLENHHTHSAVWQLLDDNGREESSYMDRIPRLTQTGRGFSGNISPRAHSMMLEHTPATGYGEAGGWNIGVGPAAFLGSGGNSRLHNWSAEAHHPTAGAGGGGGTGAHTFIDIPALLLQSADSVGEELRETDGENAWASRILEMTIGTLLPAAAVNARDFFSAAPDIVQLAGNMMLPALLGLCFIGMVHKRRAGRILRLATCAAIAATTLGVSSQLAEGIYIFIAAVAGVAFSFITLTA